ncbi:putative Vgr-related protein [Aquitalea magnusonii]|uniref:Putative Vgr-related protein n=1 Tax=Aquitalea magnusonii TaxID=332411 RepID=A0A3G9GEF0_9NEIS|nr:putative Vgr-related protein [Aquitalea magnusonii]
MDFSSLLASFAAAFSQHQRLLTLQLDGGQIAAEQLLPHTLDGSEGVSQAYRYQLTCLSPDGTIELKSLLGVAARLGGLDAAGSQVVRCGVVSRAELSSEHGHTQLNQGYLTHPRSNGKDQPRGEGFELRTDLSGALRAGQGLLISTEAQSGASGKQLAREHAQRQLDAALSLSQSLGDTAAAQLADSMETGPDAITPDNGKDGNKDSGHLQHHAAALKAWEAGSNTDKDGKTAKHQAGQQPLLILSAPA